MARAALEELALDRIAFIPAARSPFKPGAIPAGADLRLRWLRIALAGWTKADVDDLANTLTFAIAGGPTHGTLSGFDGNAGTVTYTLIMHDPDTAPRKSITDILHWMAFNIPGGTTALPEGVATTPSLPDGTVQPNNFGGKPGFMGPGARGVYHHYTIELFAFDTKLSLGPDATREQVMAAMDGHIVGKAAIEGRFRR